MPSYPHFAVRFQAISSGVSVATNTILVFPTLAPKDFLLPRRTRPSKKSKICPITSALTGVSSAASIPEMSGGALWGVSDRDQEGRCNVTMVEATVQREGFRQRKEQTSRSKTKVFARVVV